MGKHIQGSPFKIKVGEREVGDAKKVLVSGKALIEGKTHTDNTFNIDTRKAGYGGLSLSIEGPSKAEIKCKDNENGTLDISYRPTEPGYYIMNLKFADHHVDGSPFTIKVTGEGSNTQTERIKRDRAAVPQTEVGSKCRLAFKIPGVSTMDLSACVTSPSGLTEGADIAETEDGGYGVSFVPNMLGVHSKLMAGHFSLDLDQLFKTFSNERYKFQSIFQPFSRVREVQGGAHPGLSVPVYGRSAT